MYNIGQIVGSLIPTFLISRLFFWVTKKWDGGIQRIVFVHIVALIVATLLGGMGMADGGAFAAVKAFQTYIIPQLVWLVIDVVRFKRKDASSEAKSIEN